MGGPDTNVERELKLDVGLRFELPELTGVLPGVVATRLPDAKLQAIYIDTPDLRLMRWGVTLRHRRDTVGGAGAESGWTLKLPGDADGVALVRTELSWPGAFGPVPPEAAAMVRAQARTARLGPVAKLLTQRHRVELRDGAGRKLGEVDDDVVSVMDGRRLAARFRQVELEVTDAAPEELLEEAMRALMVAGAVPGDDRPKVVRAIGPRASQGPDIVVPALDGDSTVAQVIRAAIAAGVTRMVHHDPGMRLGDDPEHVHQARVGTRRLRSDLRTFWRLLDADWAGPVRTELGWLAAALGEVRDTDVLMGRFRAQIRSLAAADAKAAAALLRRLATQRDEARERLTEVLDSDRYLILLENLAHAAAHPPLARPQPDLDASVAANGSAAEVGENGSRLPAPAGRGVSPAPPAGRSPLPVEPSSAVAADPGSTVEAIEQVIAATASTAARAAGGALAATLGVPAPPDAGAPAAPVPAAVPGADQAVQYPPGVGERPAAEALPGLVRRPWRHLKQAVDHLGDDPPDEALHEIRIRAKRLRYAAEAVSGVIGKPARQLASAAAALQGVLGDMQDAVVAETWLRRQASSSPPSQALVAGELVTLQRQEQAARRCEWGQPWKAASKKSLRKWLKA